jgi:hypothetical protein
VRPREHDAVREARDALLIVVAGIPVVAVIAGLLGVSDGGYAYWQRWLTGSAIVGALLLGTLASALLIADRAGHRMLGARPHPVRRHTLIGIALAVGFLLVIGTPTTWPVIIGFAIVCALLGGLIVIGAMFNM